MGLIDRAKNMLLTPASEWPVVAAEPASPASLLTAYALPFMLIAPLAVLLGSSLLGRVLGGARGQLGAGLGSGLGIGAGLGLAVATFVFAAVTVVGLALLANVLAPLFGGERNSTQAFKLVVYSSTASWLSGILIILQAVGWMLMFFAAVYSCYTFYLGLPVLMRCPRERTRSYFVVIVIAWMLLAYVFRRLAYSAAFHL